jgi:hypothetical protein
MKRGSHFDVVCVEAGKDGNYVSIKGPKRCKTEDEAEKYVCKYLKDRIEDNDEDGRWVNDLDIDNEDLWDDFSFMTREILEEMNKNFINATFEFKIKEVKEI